MPIARRQDLVRVPDADALRHRGRRRLAFAVVAIGGGHRWGPTAVAIAALVAAGALGGGVIGALMEVSVEDGEDELLAQRARVDASAPLDETDVGVPAASAPRTSPDVGVPARQR